MYFFTLLVLNTLQIIFGSIKITPFVNNLVYFFNPSITVILMSRFLFNLRSFDLAKSDTTVTFTSQINIAIGTFGAPLADDGFHTDGSEPASIRSSVKQIAENPLSAGLWNDNSPNSAPITTKAESKRKDDVIIEHVEHPSDTSGHLDIQGA